MTSTSLVADSRAMPMPDNPHTGAPAATLPRIALSVVVAMALSAASATATPVPPSDGTTKPPARAAVVETTFKSVDAVVAAQWEFPERTPAPLVMIIPASSGIDRNGLPPGHDEDPGIGIYDQLAKRLVAAGMAVFRYDAPGAGRSSPGSFATERSTALEAYGRAVDHARVDTSRVFLFGHSRGTSTIAGIFPRFDDINTVAGAVLLSNVIGETDIVRVTAPSLMIVGEKYPDDLYQHGRYPAEARKRTGGDEMETELLTIPEGDHALLSTVETPTRSYFSIDERATEAMLAWLRKQVGRERPPAPPKSDVTRAQPHPICPAARYPG